jgi:hypothetical protein
MSCHESNPCHTSHSNSNSKLQTPVAVYGLIIEFEPRTLDPPALTTAYSRDLNNTPFHFPTHLYLDALTKCWYPWCALVPELAMISSVAHSHALLLLKLLLILKAGRQHHPLYGVIGMFCTAWCMMGSMSPSRGVSACISVLAGL